MVQRKVYEGLEGISHVLSFSLSNGYICVPILGFITYINFIF